MALDLRARRLLPDLTCVPVRVRRPADDGQGRSGAATDARAVDGQHGVRRRWAHGRRAEEAGRRVICFFDIDLLLLAGWLVYISPVFSVS